MIKYIADFTNVRITELEITRETDANIWYLDPNGEEKKLSKNGGAAGVCDSWGEARRWLVLSYNRAIREHRARAAQSNRHIDTIKGYQHRLKLLKP